MLWPVSNTWFLDPTKLPIFQDLFVKWPAVPDRIRQVNSFWCPMLIEISCTPPGMPFWISYSWALLRAWIFPFFVWGISWHSLFGVCIPNKTFLLCQKKKKKKKDKILIHSQNCQPSVGVSVRVCIFIFIFNKAN